MAATKQRQRKQHEKSEIDVTHEEKFRKQMKKRRTHRVWELARIRAESRDTQTQIGNVNELSRKRNKKNEFVGRKREKRREKSFRERKFGFAKKPYEREGRGFHRSKRKEKKPRK